MEIRNLKTFLKVSAIGNFTRAADELGYSQSNVSTQIAQLETEIGVPLFNRIGRRISLTQFGEQLLPYAREICATAEKMETMMKSDEFLGGTVRLGMTDSISELSLEQTFLSFHQRFPYVQLEITVDTTANLLNLLHGSELDAACVISEPLNPAKWQIWKEISAPIVVVCNSAMGLAKQNRVSLEELSLQQMVLMETNAPYSAAFEQALARNNLDCHPVFRIQSARTALHLVENAQMISVLPQYAVCEAVRSKRVTVLNVPEWKHSQAIRMIMHHSKIPTPQITGLLEELDRGLFVQIQ